MPNADSLTPKLAAARALLFASLVSLASSWETMYHFVELVIQREGNPDHTELITGTLIVFVQTLAIAKTDLCQLPLRNLSAGAFVLLLTLGLISTSWSYVPTYATFEWLLLVTTVLAFMGIATRYGTSVLLIGQFIACETIIVAAIASDEFSFSDGGYFVYPGKLSPIVQIALCILVGLLITSRLNSSKLRAKALITTGLILLNFAALLNIENRTGQLSSLITLGFGILVVCARLTEKATKKTKLTQALTRLGAPVILLTSFLLMRFTPSSFFGREFDTTFTGRKTLWKAAWEGTIDRPIFGWGWVSGWFNPVYRDTVLPEVGGRAPRFYWSHSVWLDLGLSVGFIGIVLAFIAIMASVTSSLRGRKFDFTIATSTLLVTTLTVHLMFESLHRDMQLAFAVLLIATLNRKQVFGPPAISLDA